MTLEKLFDKLDALDPNSQLAAALDSILTAFEIGSDYDAGAVRTSVETAKWSARQNPKIAKRYCRELDWSPDDLATMMVMQCAIEPMTSGEFMTSRGVLNNQGEGFRFVWENCVGRLTQSGRIDDQIAEIERSELDAELAETDISWHPKEGAKIGLGVESSAGNQYNNGKTGNRGVISRRSSSQMSNGSVRAVEELSSVAKASSVSECRLYYIRKAQDASKSP